MKRQTLRDELDDALERNDHRRAANEAAFGVEIVHAVALTDYPSTTAAFAQLEQRGEIQRAEIAQLRMLLREAMAQLERANTGRASFWADYKRLTGRVEKALAHTTNGDTE